MTLKITVYNCIVPTFHYLTQNYHCRGERRFFLIIREVCDATNRIFIPVQDTKFAKDIQYLEFGKMLPKISVCLYQENKKSSVSGKKKYTYV